MFSLAGKTNRCELPGKRFRALFRDRCEADHGQKGTDQRHQQVDFHVILRCALAAYSSV
jgi:hypothetical protein